MTDADLVGHIARLPHRRGNFKQFDSRIGSERRATRGGGDRAGATAARGDLIEVRPGLRPSPPAAANSRWDGSTCIGNGYGFLICRPAHGRHCGDIFIPRESAKAAMHGDRVVVRIRAHRGGPAARGWRDCEVLKRAYATVVGEFRIGRRGQ